MNRTLRLASGFAGKHILTVSSLLLLPVLAGCGMAASSGGPGQSASLAPVAEGISGVAHGGQQPISGMNIYFFEAGVATSPSYAATPVSLLTSSSGTATSPVSQDSDGNYYVTTNANGQYSVVSTSYNCAAAIGGVPQQVYVLGVGGKPDGVNANSYITLMAAFGDCSSLGSSSVIDLSEITTAAAATALQQFANFVTGYTVTPVGFSTSSTNMAGLRRAILTANNLASLQTGLANTVTPTTGAGIVPWKLLTDFGNVLGFCVNSDPSSSSSCSTLSTDATGSSSPIADTLTVALKMALNPSNNVSKLWNDMTPQAAFGQQLSAAPVDWSIAITWIPETTGTYFKTPYTLAIDANGDVWTQSFNAKYVFELDNAGNLLSPVTGFAATTNTAVRNIVIDQSGNAWAVGGGIWVLSPTGTLVASKSLTGAYAVAIDANNDGWVDAYSGTTFPNTALYQYTLSGSTLTQTTITNGTLIYTARNVAFDTNGYIWSGNQGTASASSGGTTTTVMGTTDTTPAAMPITGSPFSINSTTTAYDINPYTIAFDHQNYAWISAAGGVAEFSPATSSGTTLQSGTQTRGVYGVTNTGSAGTAVAVDGTGNVWLASYNGGATNTSGVITTTSNLEKYAGSQASTPGAALTGTAGLRSDQSSIDKPEGIAIDGSGNVWLANIGIVAHATGSLTEFVGVASPVITPIAAALHQNKLGVCP